MGKLLLLLFLELCPKCRSHTGGGDIVVGVVTWLRAGRFGVRIPPGAIFLFSLPGFLPGDKTAEARS